MLKIITTLFSFAFLILSVVRPAHAAYRRHQHCPLRGSPAWHILVVPGRLSRYARLGVVSFPRRRAHRQPSLMTPWRSPTVLWMPLVGILTAALVTVLAAGASWAADLPAGIVYLRDVAPTIRQDMRYAGYHNFIGRPIDGYSAAECILSVRAAQALTAAQAEVAVRGLSLIVWDCYRPARAVADFKRWSTRPNDATMKEEFYPNTDASTSARASIIRSSASPPGPTGLCCATRWFGKASSRTSGNGGTSN